MDTNQPLSADRDPAESKMRSSRHFGVRMATWGACVLGVLVIVAVVAVAILLHSQRFHDYLLGQLESRASNALGVRVSLQNFTLHLSTLNLDLYGLKVAGAAPYSDPPLLQVQHAEAGVRVVSVLRRQWYLDNLRVEHPILQIVVDKDGHSNLPVFQGGGGSSSNPNGIFDLGVRHAVVDHGEVYYNNRASQLDADLHDLEFHSSFGSLQQKYSGVIAYSNGRIAYGSYQPVAHSLSAEFYATPTKFSLSKATLSIGKSQINLVASLTNYRSPVAEGEYDIAVDGGEVGRIIHSPSIPSGVIQASGSMQYQYVPNRPLLELLRATGELKSHRLVVDTRAVRAQVTDLAARYSLENGEIALHDLTAALMGGELSAKGRVQIAGERPHSELSATLRGISLTDVQRALGQPASKLNLALSGQLNGGATGTWGKTLDDLVTHADATIDGEISGAQQAVNGTAAGATPARNTIPIESAVHGTYTAKSGQLALASSYLHTLQTSLTMNGVVSKQSSLSVQLDAKDLKEVEAIADLFRPSPNGQQAPSFGLAGSASFQGTVQGSMSIPRLSGQLIASNLQFNGSSWKTVRANLDASPSLVSVRNADLEPASRGRIRLDGSVALNKWAFANTSDVQINLNAAQLNVADLTRFAGQQIPVTGTLAAKLSLHGTELNPTGNGDFSLSDGTAYDEPIQLVKVNFAGAGDEVRGELSVQAAAGALDCKATVRPKEKTYSAQLTSSGIQLSKLELVKSKKINAAGVLTVNANGQGSFDNPQVSATVQIPKLTIQNQTVTGINLQADLANHVANASLTTSAVNTSIQAKARVALTGEYPADATLDTQQIPLVPLLAEYAPDLAGQINGQTEIHATLHGPLKNPRQLEVHVTVPDLKLAYGSSIQLEAAAPIRVDYKDQVINVQRSAIRGTDTDLEFQGSIGTASGGPMALMLLGTINLQIAQLFDPDLRSSGQIKFNLNSNGLTNGPDIGGHIDIVDASLTTPDLPVGLEHANGTLTVTKDRINVANFQGTMGGGKVTAQGGVAYRPRLQFDLGAIAQGIRVLYPQGMRESVDANLRLSGSMENAVLGGTVNLADLSFTPAFDLSSFIGQFSGGVAVPSVPGFNQNLQLRIGVHSSNDVDLVSRALSLNGSANLQVQGTAANPVILGRVNLAGGDILLNGDRFVLDGGTIQFINPSETEPVVNLSVATTIQQYNITLRFEGTPDQLRTQYSSDPALPQADIINLLAFGQTTEASAVNGAATTTNQAAIGVLASQVSSQVSSRISKVAGISQLSISPVLTSGTTQGPPGANITIQQRVTGNLFVTFSTNVASTQSQVIQGQYQVSPKVALSVTRDQNGGFGFDALIKKSW